MVLLFLSSFVRAEAGKLRFQHPVNTGAYNNSVIQDRDGFVWIGCSQGIIRYDGYDLKTYKAGPSSLSSSYAPGIFEDDQGLLWIGTMGGGLNVFDKKTNSFAYYKHDPGNPASLNCDQFNWAPETITQDGDGIIWMGTIGGVNSFDKKNKVFESFRHDSANSNSLGHNSVWTIMAGPDNLIWIGTNAGLDSYNKETRMFTHYRYDPGDSHSLGEGKVYAIERGDNGILWIGTSRGGLDRFDPATKTFKRYMHNPDNPKSIVSNEVYSITRDRNGNLWLGRSYAVAAGLEIFNPENETFTHISHDSEDEETISGDIVMGCFEDRSGIMWVVENTGPVDKYDPNLKPFKTYRNNPRDSNSLSSNVVPTIFEDHGGNIWFSTQLGGLNRMDKDGKFTLFKKDPVNPQGISDNYVFSILEDSENNLWISMNDGIHGVFDPDTARFIKKYQNPFAHVAARGMIEDFFDKNILWFGSETDGVFRFKKDTGRFKQFVNSPHDPDSLAMNNVLSLFQDREGSLWLPTQGGGLDLFHRDTQTFSHFRNRVGDPNTISGNTVRDCLIDSLGNFWVSTGDGGLNKFNKERGTFKSFGERDGFPTNSIKSILEDGHQNLWLSSDIGIIKFDIKKEKVTWIYNRWDGLQGDNFSMYPSSALKTRDGQMWFSGLNGVNAFYPGKIRSNTYIPPVVLLSIRQGEKSLSPNQLPDTLQSLSLGWRDNLFEFEFAALNYSQPEKNHYAYFLEGFENKRNYIKDRRYGKYTNLPGGNYVLRLFGSNNDGVWNNRGTAVKIHVATKPWKTWWAILIYLFSLIGMFLLFVRIKARGYERQLARERKISEQLIHIDNMRSDLLEKQKIVEQELIRSKDDLEMIVAQRTAELKEAMERAEDANRAKSQFLANMSHEIRTPLNLILGFSQTLENDIEDPTHREYLSSIRSSGRTLLKLLNDVLDLSKVEANKFSIEYHAFNIRQLLREVQQMFSENFERKGVEFRLDISRYLPEIIILDEIRLRQILVNVVGNAIKFTERGFVGVGVEYGQQVPSSGYKDLTIVIEDTGVGIAEDQREAIFKVFSQQKGQDVNRYGGTGLGLAISRRLAEIMDGQISVDSVLNQGSRFTIQFKNVQSASLVSMTRNGDALDDLNMSFEGASILIVDANEINRDIMVNFLRDFNFEITRAPDLSVARKIMSGKKVDLVIWDIAPDTDFPGELQSIKEDNNTGDVPVIVIGDSPAEDDQCFNCFLAKPVAKDKLISALGRFLEHTRVDLLNIEEKSPPLAGYVSSENLEGLKRLRENLKEIEATIWLDLKDAMVMENVKKFSRQLKALAQEFEYQYLYLYGEKLGNQAAKFDMELLPSSLNDFPKIVETLAEIIEKASKK